MPHGETVTAALGEIGVAVEVADFLCAHAKGVASVDNRLDGRDEEHWYLQGYVEALGIRETDRRRVLEVLRDLWNDPSADLWRQVIAESVRGLRSLAELDLPLGIVSNSDGTVEERLQRLEICQVGPGSATEVVAVVDSTVIGVAKPDPRAFAPAIAALGLPANEVAFVGDSVCFDVLGSERAGLQPIHLDPYHACESPHQHRHIRALGELQIIL